MHINDLSEDIRRALSDADDLRAALAELGLLYERALTGEAFMLRSAQDASIKCRLVHDRIDFIIGRLHAQVEESRR